MNKLVRRFWLTAALLAVAPCLTPAESISAAAPPPAKLTAEDYGRLPFVSRLALSPDGKRWVGLMAVGGTQVLVVLNVFDKPQLVTKVRVPEGTNVTWLYWANNDNVLIGLQALLPVEGQDWYVTRMLALNCSTSRLTKLLWDLNGQNGGSLVWAPKDGGNEVLISAQASIYESEAFWPAVYRVDVTNGHSHLVIRPHAGVMHWYADAAGVVRAGVGYEDTHRTSNLLYRSTGGATSFRTVDRADSRKQERLLEPELFLPGDHALAIHDNAENRSALYEIDLLTGKDLRTVYEPSVGDVTETITSADDTAILGVWTDAMQDNVHWIDAPLAELQSALDHAIANASARIVSFNNDRTRMLVNVGAADMAGMLYYFDIAAGKLQRIAYYNDAIGTRHLAPVKAVSYKARDGLGIEAILTLPNDRPAHNLPIVIFPHGGPWAQDRLDYDYVAQFMASLGYAVLQPNFRGSTGYGDTFLHAGDGQLGLSMQDDLSDGLHWAVQEGIADGKRACIVGASYGGYAAMWGIVKDPDQYRCAVSISGVSSLKREVNEFGGTLYANASRDAWERMTPDFDAVSPLNAVGNIKAPLLLIHGKKDITVQYVQSTKMEGRMRKAGKLVEFLPLPEADHYFGREADRVAMLKAIEAFLLKHNPPD